MSALQDMVIAAIEAAPRPMTKDQMLAVVQQTLRDANAGKEAKLFETWFETNGDWLLNKYA